MLRKKFIFVVALVGMISAGLLVKRSMKPPVQSTPVIEPLQKPFPQVVAAAGLIESLGENLNIGSPESGVVQEVYVNVGDSVQQGTPLFKIDSRPLEAELKIDQAKEEVALAEYQRVHDQLERLRAVKNQRAISQEELCSKEKEKQLAWAKLCQARVEKEKTHALIERLLVRSPMDGLILQKNIKKGEFLYATNPTTAPVVIGDTTLLQIRADIDEQNALHIVQGAPGVASPKNCPETVIPLKFVRVEPYVIPKKSLTGSSTEKVDTRVLQVIYTFAPPKNLSLYIGQQVDVYIERPQDTEVNAHE